MTHKLNKLFDLSGRVAIVTGGQGLLGSQYVKTLGAAGAKVAVFDISDQANDSLKSLIEQGKVMSCQVDITDFSAVKKAVDQVQDQLGLPTILVNNAGLGTIPNASGADNGPFEDYPESSWDAMLDSHLKGMFNVSKAVIKKIKAAQKQGSVVNVSSTYGLVSPDQSLYEFRRRRGEDYYKPIAYTVAKAGVLGFTKWLAEYCGPAIRVNTLVPGGVETGELNSEFKREYSKRTILGRMAQPDDYNAAMLFLASDASAYMTGATLVIDGGWTAK